MGKQPPRNQVCLCVTCSKPPIVPWPKSCLTADGRPVGLSLVRLSQTGQSDDVVLAGVKDTGRFAAIRLISFLPLSFIALVLTNFVSPNHISPNIVSPRYFHNQLFCLFSPKCVCVYARARARARVCVCEMCVKKK